MKQKIIHIILLCAVIFVAVSCSVRKNNRLTRSYHAFTTRYNVHFNGNENLKEQLKLMQLDYEDDYTGIIGMHPVSAHGKEKATKPKGSFDRSIEKAQKAIREHSIKKSPKRDPKKMNDPAYRSYVKRDEFNPYIHNSWRIMALSQFYKGDFLGASATFIYIIRHFDWKPDLVAESRIWLARCYLEMNWLYEAEDVLYKINNDGLPPSQEPWFATVNADYLIRKGDYRNAVPFLLTAIKNEPHKVQKSRMTFLLAQVYTVLDQKKEAYTAYSQVINMSPPYRTEFNARIKQSEVFDGANIASVEKSLLRMAKADRNKEYLDQVYYAVGNLHLSRKDTIKAISNYLLAVEKSTRNGVDKAVVQLSLGDLYFNRRDYVKAQPCYTEAIPLLREDYPNLEMLRKRSEVLDEMAVYAQNVELQDSLLRIADLPEEERMKVAQRIVDDIIKKEEDAAELAKKEAYLAEQEANGSQQMNNKGGANAPTTPTMNMGAADNSWYFYNKSLVSSGRTDFQKKWGRRKLEDDWRRRNKHSFSMNDFAENTTPELGDKAPQTGGAPSDSLATDTAMKKANDPKDPNFYLQQLPLTPEEKIESHAIIAEGLFNIGLILKNKLEDFEASLSTFDDLDKRYPDNEYRLEAYYNIYLIYARLGDMAMADKYKQLIIASFPQSDYAVALSNPRYLDNLKNMAQRQDSIYQVTYDAYLANNGTTVHANMLQMNQEYPLSPLLPKFMFLDALAYVGEGESEEFKKRLRTLVEKYPDSDVSPLATSMLRSVARGKEVISSGQNARGLLWETRFNAAEGDSTGVDNKELAPFTVDKSSPHLFILAFPTDSISANQVLFDVAKYNFFRLVVKDFDLEIMTFNQITMLVIKGFNNFAEITEYRRMMDRDKAVTLPSVVRPVVISESNFKLLLEGRSLDDYFKFDNKNSLQQ